MGTNEGLLARISREQEVSYKPKCSVGKKILALSPQDQKDLAEALENQEIFGSVIAKVLGVGDYSLRRHRRHMCRCGLSGPA